MAGLEAGGWAGSRKLRPLTFTQGHCLPHAQGAAENSQTSKLKESSKESVAVLGTILDLMILHLLPVWEYSNKVFVCFPAALSSKQLLLVIPAPSQTKRTSSYTPRSRSENRASISDHPLVTTPYQVLQGPLSPQFSNCFHLGQHAYSKMLQRMQYTI